MKKIIFTIILLLSISLLYADNIRIMSFNIGGHASKNHRIDNSKWVNGISTIMKNSKADIILLQEFPIENHNKQIIDIFIDKIGNAGWMYFCTDKYITIKKGSGFDQNSIIFYNLHKVLPTSKKDKVINFESEKRKYNFIKNNLQVVQFCLSSNQSKEFFIINVHLPDDNNHYYEDLSELSRLYVDLGRQNKIIIGGDFNTPRDFLKQDTYGTHFSDAIVDFEFFTGGDFRQSLKTTINKTDDTIKLCNDYDHFIIKGLKINRGTTHAFNINDPRPRNTYNGGVRIDQNLIYKSNKKYFKDISDHFPIIIDVDI